MGVAKPPTAVEIEGSDAKVGFFQRHFETLPKAKDEWAINSLKVLPIKSHIGCIS